MQLAIHCHIPNIQSVHLPLRENCPQGRRSPCWSYVLNSKLANKGNYNSGYIFLLQLCAEIEPLESLRWIPRLPRPWLQSHSLNHHILSTYTTPHSHPLSAPMHSFCHCGTLGLGFLCLAFRFVWWGVVRGNQVYCIALYMQEDPWCALNIFGLYYLLYFVFSLWGVLIFVGMGGNLLWGNILHRHIGKY